MRLENNIRMMVDDQSHDITATHPAFTTNEISDKKGWFDRKYRGAACTQ